MQKFPFSPIVMYAIKHRKHGHKPLNNIMTDEEALATPTSNSDKTHIHMRTRTNFVDVWIWDLLTLNK